MNINRRIVGSMLVAGVLLTSAGSVFSQETPSSEGIIVVEAQRRSPDLVRPMRQTPDDNFFVVTSDMSFEGKLVKGAPYSAQGITEIAQILADGNRIVKKSTTLIYRDSEGRTRREHTFGTLGPLAVGSEPARTIYINDPVAGVSYILDGRTHVARKMPSFQTVQTEWKASGQAIKVLPSPAGQMREEGEGTRAKPESLAKQNVEGVEAEGTRQTVTIPADAIGNERPIEIVYERWYSSELQTVVMIKQSDPRFGETVYRLTNINRGEQPKSLFEVPGDYTVKSTSVGVGSGVGGGSGTGGGVGNSTVSGSGMMASPGANPAVKAIQGGALNGKAISLPLPVYPPIAQAANASGSVTVQITVDEDGNVISAEAASGHPLLRAAAVTAAREAKFSPTRLSGQPVKVQGVLVYNFQTTGP